MKVKKEILRGITGEIYKVKEYDERGNLIYFKDNFAGRNYEEWRTYDKNNNLIKLVDSNGTEIVHKYDDNGIRIDHDVYEYEFYPEEEEIEDNNKEKFSLKTLFSN